MNNVEISKIEEYLAKNRHPLRRSIDLQEYIEILYEYVYSGQIAETDGQFEKYIEKLNETNQVSRSEMIDVLEDGSIDTHINRSDLRFGVFTCLINLLNYDAIEENERYGGEFQDRRIYPYFKSMIYDRPFDPNKRKIALESAYKASETVDGNQRVYLRLASIIVGVVNSRIDHSLEELPTERTDLLDLAKDNLNKAKAIDSENPHIYEISCLLRLEQGEIDKAEKELNEAVRYSRKEDSTSNLDHVFLRSSIRDLRVVTNFIENNLKAPALI